MRRTTLCLVCATLVFGPVRGDDEPARTDPMAVRDRADASIRVATRFAGEYTLRFADDESSTFMLVEKPVLRWTNPVPQSADSELPEVYGGVYLWTSAGRPAAVASIFRWYHPWKHVNLEMLALAERPVVAELAGEPVWQPKRTDIEYTGIPEAGRPAPAAPARLLQMRRIARGFVATKADKDDNRTELRLLPQPLYRYEIADEGRPEVLDGALFVVAHGTDPEVVLMIEARPKQDGSGSEWQFAAARMNHLDMWLTYGGKEVWRVRRLAPYSVVTDQTEPYSQLKRTRAEVDALEADSNSEEIK